MDRVPMEQNIIHSPPTSQSSAIERNPVVKRNPVVERYEHKEKKKKSMGPGGISFIVGGGTLVVSCVAIYVSVRVHKYRSQQLQENGSAAHTLPLSTARGEILTN